MIQLRVYHLLMIITLSVSLPLANGFAKGITIDWYDPNFEGKDSSGFARISIAGQTEPDARVQVENSKIIIIRSPQKSKKLPQELSSGAADENGYFEFTVRLPQGLLQVPILLKGTEKQTILVLFDVGEKSVKLNTKTKKRPVKLKEEAPVVEAPVATSKPTRYKEPRAVAQPQLALQSKSDIYTFFLGAGGNFQRLGQKQEGSSDLSFQNLQYVSMFSQLRYENSKFAVDLGYQIHPTSVTQATAPYTILNGNTNWSVLDLSMWWRMGSSKVRFGVESHQIPFLSVNQSSQVNLTNNSMLAVALGYGLTAGDLQSWLFDFGISYLYPVSYDSPDLKNFSLLPKLGLEVELAITKSISERSLWGLKWTTLVQSHGFTYRDSTTTTIYNGTINLLLSAVFLNYGYKF